MSDFRLEAVICKNCGSGLVVEINDNIVYCSSCGSGFEILQEGLVPIEINFAAAAIRAEGEMIYKPFWLLKSTVNIFERKSSGAFLKNLFGGSNESTSGDIAFYVPAFYCPLEVLKNISTKFTLKNPIASPQKYNVSLKGFDYGKQDAKKLSEFLLISFEAEKSDVMKNFRYELVFHSMEILGIPFYDLGKGRLKDAVLGTEIQI
ncbi:MAG: hypothetical protein JST15_01140 [Bacteroidetes bacterium]|nr:hypothetical protein [Bacteroidota bacterium]